MQQVWRNRWRNTGWLALGAITLVLLGAGVHKKNNKICNGIEVVFDGDGNNYFIDEKGVAALLKANGVAKGLAIDNIDLEVLEQKLKNDKWIMNAELYFDNHQVLKAWIEEKEPIARVFTVNGSSFYIDSACRRLPLSERLSARIPMFTNFPSERQTLSKPDSQLLTSIKELAVFIQSDQFWKAQVAQVDITPGGFEMIPTVGNHVVALGKGGEYQQKFDRLYSFYKQVWTKVGFERYESVDVRFEGQVVATVKGARSSLVVDSVKAKQAIESLIAGGKPSADSIGVTTHDDASVTAAPITVLPMPTVATNVVNANNTNGRTPVRVNKPSEPAKDTARRVRPAAQQTVTANLLNARTKKILPKATLPKQTVKKSPVKKDVIKSALTDEEEMIRREAIKQQLKAGRKKG